MTGPGLVVVAAIAFATAALLMARAAEQKALARSRRTFRVRFPRELSVHAVSSYLQGLSGVLRPAFRGLLGWPAVIFEVRADGSGISHWLKVPSEWGEYVLGQLRAAVPSVRITESVPDQLQIRRGCELRLRRGHVRLRVEEAAAVASSMLATLHPLDPNEGVVLQWVVAPALVERPTESELAPDDLRDVLAGRQPLPQLSRSERGKLAEPLFLCVGRIAVQASTTKRAAALLQRVLASVHASRTHEARLVPRLLPGSVVRRRVNRGYVPVLGFPSTLNSAELAALAAWPMESPVLPGLVLGGARELPPPPNVPSEGSVLGMATYPGAERPVAVSVGDLSRHCLVVGPTGVGKSVLLNNLAVSHINDGHGLLLVDPAGDLAARIIDSIPREREGDVIFIDPADTEYPVGLNFLSGSERSGDLVVDDFVAIVKRAWGEHLVGSRSEDILRMACLTCVSQPDAVLTDLPRLLLDKGFRRQIVSALDDPIALQPFWAWYESLTAPRQAEVIGPISNKLRSFYRPILRNIISQVESSFSLTEAMQDGKVIIVSLARGQMGEGAATFFGAMVMSLWAQAVHARVSISPKDRRPFFALVDEFQSLLGFSTPMDEMLAQARKYGASLTLATQGLSVLPPELRQACLLNTRTKVVWATGASDAPLFAKEFAPHLTAEDLRSLDAFHGYTVVSAGSQTSAPISIRTLPAPETTGSSDRVREQSRDRYGRPRAQVETALRARQAAKPAAAPIGRKARR